MTENDVIPEPLADLRLRAVKALVIAEGQSLPAHQRVVQSLEAFNGTLLTGLPPKIKRAVETHFLAAMRVLNKYDLKSGEDYQRVAEADLLEILGIVKNLVAKILRVRG